MTKVCTKCLEEKSLECFSKDKYQKDGRSSQCKSCKAEYLVEWRKKNKIHIAEYILKYKKDFMLFNSTSEVRLSIGHYEEVKQSKDGYLMVKCSLCGEWYTPTYRSIASRVEAINGIQAGDSNLYCSDECKQACPIYNQAKYPKDYKKSTSNPYYTQAELKVWSKEVLSRANYICELCGKEAVHSHHIEPKKLQPALALDPDNGIAVCKDCHYNKLHVGSCSTGALANVACAN